MTNDDEGTLGAARAVRLDDLVEELLREVREEASGRAARTLTPGAGTPLKQTLLALASGQSLQDHVAPGPATIQVLTGRVRLTVGPSSTTLGAGDWSPIPEEVHGLSADEDAVALLTVASGARGTAPAR